MCTFSEEDDVEGISLIDGSYPNSCSIDNCVVKKLTIDEALDIKLNGPSDEIKKSIEEFHNSEWGSDSNKPWW